ncbi:MAG: sugar MFS transporter, partial [Proteobacteria bacterium]
MNSTVSRGSTIRSLVFLASLFFIFGFLTCMNDILVPHLKGLFTLSYTEAVLIQFAFFAAYFIFSIPSSNYCERVGYKTALVVGLGITALGAFGFLASASFHSFAFFLGAVFVLATGITLIQVAANPYVTALGAPETASSRLTIVQAFNSLGTTIAPVVGSALILSNASADSIKKPYLMMAIFLLVLAGATLLMKLPRVNSVSGAKDNTTWSELFQNRRLMMGVAGIFAYVGAEVAIGSFLISWLGDESIKGFSAETAGHYVAFYWGGAMVGRFVGTPLLAKFNPSKVLQFFVAGAILGVATTMFTSGDIAMWSVLIVGFFNSIMFPTIFSLSVQGMTRGTEKASGLLCTAIVGGAIVPLFQGIVADSAGLRVSFVLPIICYVYLFVFARVMSGAKVKAESGAAFKLQT